MENRPPPQPLLPPWLVVAKRGIGHMDASADLLARRKLHKSGRTNRLEKSSSHWTRGVSAAGRWRVSRRALACHPLGAGRGNRRARAQESRADLALATNPIQTEPADTRFGRSEPLM